MVEIKTFYKDWQIVSRKQAVKFVKTMLNGMQAIRAENKADYINKRHLRGITLEKLFNGQ